MTGFQIKRQIYNLTAHAGLSMVGQYLKRFAQIDQIIDPRFPIVGQGGIATSSLIKAYVGLLCTGKSDFDTIESLRRDAFFKSALGLAVVPSSPTLRQRMDAVADAGDSALTALDEANACLLCRDKSTLIPLPTGRLPLDVDVFTLDNSGTRKAGSLDWLVKWNASGFDVAAPHQRLDTDPAAVWCHACEGRHKIFETEAITRERDSVSVSMNRVVHLIERTIDRHGQVLLMPNLEVESRLTSLDLPTARVVKLYQGLGTYKQFHSGFKTDLYLERLPSGKFATNDLVLSLAVLAFNILRAIGQATLICQDSPVRHAVKRRRIRTVMQAILSIAVRVIQHARELTLGLGERCGAFAVFERHLQSLLQFSD